MTTPDGAAIFVAVFLPFVAAATVPLLFQAIGEETGYLAAGAAIACFGLLASQLGSEGTVALSWIPSLDVSLRFYVDAWALLFALLASGIGVLVFTYSPSYMHGESGLTRYYAALLAFMGSILGVALAADLIALFLFWELTSLCSFVLIGHYSADEGSQYAARMAMLVTVGGGLFLLVGFLLLRLAAASPSALGVETFDLALMLENPEAMQAALRETGLFLPVLALVAIGAGAKSAQVPLHFWLPNAMAAPTPVSAFLHSATMVKVGVYLVGRLRPMLLSQEWTLLFATVGLVTMTVTAAMAVASTDVKELLAYSTASHLGLMIAGFGFRSPVGAETGVFHLFNHALFKAALFLVAGIVAHEAGTRRISELGGLRHDLPVTALIAAVAALGMAGVPPFNGFYSKELLFEAAYEASHAAGALGWLYPAVAVFGSVFTFLYSIRFLAMFFGSRPAELGPVHSPSMTLLAPPALLAGLAAVVAVNPHLAVDAIVQSAAESTAVESHEMHTGIPTEYSPAVGLSLLALGLGAVAYAVVPTYERLHAGIRAGLGAVPPIRTNWWYDRAIADLERTAAVFTPRIHNGLLRTYAAWLLGTASAMALTGYVAAGLSVPSFDGLTVSLAMVLVLFVAIVAAVTVAVAPSHVAGVLTLSLLGFMVAIVYILASAPDLALTQLVVETLALLIFLLVLEEIPEFYGDYDPGEAARDAALSIVVGATVFLTVVFATASDAAGEPNLARFFAERAVPEGGGTNIVNVILVDFRGFDTLGELVVIVLTALSVLTLVMMRTRGEAR